MPAPPGEPAPIAGQGYELVWEDDFEGTAINDEIWQPPPWYESGFQWNQVTVADSILTLTADTTPPAGRPFVELWTCGQSSPTYPHRPNALAWQEGYFEFHARAFCPSGLPADELWIKLALWFMSLEAVNSWPAAANTSLLRSEWDMVENGIAADGADVEHVSVIHRNTPGGISDVPDASRFYSVAGTNLLDWHTWGGQWTGATVSTYLDGVFKNRQAAYDSTAQPMCMILSSAALGIPPAGASETVPEFIVTEVDWVRVWQRPAAKAKRCAMSLPGSGSSKASTPNDAGLTVTTGIDIRVDAAANVAKPAAVQAMATRTGAAGQWAWQFAIRAGGAMRLTWSADGSVTIGPDSAVPAIVNGERIVRRAWLVGNNGSSQRVLTYYVGPTMNGPWTQVGTPITGAVTSIFAATAPLDIGARGSIELFDGLIYGVEVRADPAGPVVARFDATDKTPGDGTVTDESGKVFTLSGNARIVQGNPKPDLYKTSSPLRLA
jgi:hypothetical protein